MADRPFGSFSSSAAVALAAALGSLLASVPAAAGDRQAAPSVTAGAECRCPVPGNNVSRSRQGGPAACVAAQDAQGCTLQSIAVPQPGPERPGQPDDREALERLDRMSRPGGRLIGEEDPDTQLQTAMQTPPAAWTATEFGAVRASLLAVAEKRLARDELAELNEALELNAAALLRIFTDVAYQRRVEHLPLGRFEASVSYGCLRVAEVGGATVAIRAPFSGAIRSQCDA